MPGVGTDWVNRPIRGRHWAAAMPHWARLRHVPTLAILTDQWGEAPPCLHERAHLESDLALRKTTDASGTSTNPTHYQHSVTPLFNTTETIPLIVTAALIPR